MEEYYLPEIDRQLHCRNRSLKAYPGKMLFGPAGNRLFIDYLEKRPGFAGRIDFIHKCNIPALFEVRCQTPCDWERAQCIWYPSCMVMEYEDDNVRFREWKTITENDCAISVQTWRNQGKEALELVFVPGEDGFETEPLCENTFYLSTPVLGHGFAVGAAAGWNASRSARRLISPGEEITFLAAACTGNLNTQKRQELSEQLDLLLAAGGKEQGIREIIEDCGRSYQSFFDQIPVFRSSDKVLERTWYYRWYILRNCLSRPSFGRLSGTVMYEGRAHKMGKAPWKPKGWEFCRLICLSTPLQLTDLGFLYDKQTVHEVIRSFFRCQGEDGIVESAFVDSAGSPFCNFMVWAVYRQYLLDGDQDFIREILPALIRCVDGNRKAYRSKNDELQVEVRHQRTGKEFQPSYWYFSGYPRNPKAEGAMIPLKRVDRTIYHYLNVLGCSRLMKAVGDEGFKEYESLAADIQSQLNGKMWDDESGFYYDLHYLTDEQALVKNIVGIYPYWAGIGRETDRSFQYLFSEDYFAAGSGFATVAADCPAYSPSGGWMGVRTSRNGCMWDGPSWPYTNSIALDAAGKESKRCGHRYDKEFSRFLREYAWQHYNGRNLDEPYLVEQYHAVTGEPMSDEPDYNHSYFLRLIVEHVCGVDIEEGRIVVDPLHLDIPYFELEHLKIRGADYDIRYRRAPKEGICRQEEGFRIYRNGQLLHRSRELEKVIIEDEKKE